MIELDEQLQRLADGIELPATGPEDDLARGRRRLRRRRNLGTAGAALTMAVVVGTTVAVLSGGGGQSGADPDFAGAPSTPAADATLTDSGDHADREAQLEALAAGAARAKAAADEAEARLRAMQGQHTKAVLAGYRDILREHLDPAGKRIQTSAITNEQGADDALGTKLTWKGGGMLQVAVGRSLEGVQFFCDNACTPGSVAGASKALVLTSPGSISVAVFQDDGDIVALTADTSFGNNGTSTSSLGLTVDQLLTAAADPRLDLPDQTGQPAGGVGTQ
jgi:hypothetical protein